MTVIALVALALLTGAILGLLAARYFVVEPLWETEAALRKELGLLRGQLWTANHEIYNLRWWLQSGHTVSWDHTPEGKTSHELDAIRYVVDTPYGLHVGKNGQLEVNRKISHRKPTDVLRINSIDDLIEGTKP